MHIAQLQEFIKDEDVHQAEKKKREKKKKEREEREDAAHHRMVKADRDDPHLMNVVADPLHMETDDPDLAKET